METVTRAREGGGEGGGWRAKGRGEREKVEGGDWGGGTNPSEVLNALDPFHSFCRLLLTSVLVPGRREIDLSG